MAQRKNRRARTQQQTQGKHERLREFYTLHIANKANRAASTRRNDLAAISLLERHVRRPATLADLNNRTLNNALKAATCAKPTLARTRSALLMMARRAAGHGLIKFPNRVHAIHFAKRIAPWTLKELNQLFGAANTLPGSIAGIPADQWWPALLLTLLDTQCPLNDLLTAPPVALDVERCTLMFGPLVYSIAERTARALAEVHSLHAARLLPWHLDGGQPPFHMLYRELKVLLWKAWLPHDRSNLFDRLRITAAERPGIVEQVNLASHIVPRPGRPQFPRARDARRKAKQARIAAAESAINDSAQPLPVAPVEQSPPHTPPAVVSFKVFSPPPEPFVEDSGGLAAILDACDNVQGEMDGIPAGDWWSLLVLLVCETKSPPEDILQILAREVDPIRGWLRMGSRVFQLHGDVTRRIAATSPYARRLLLPYSSNQDLHRAFRDVLDNAGIAVRAGDQFARLIGTVTDWSATADAAQQLRLQNKRAAAGRRCLDPRRMRCVWPAMSREYSTDGVA